MFIQPPVIPLPTVTIVPDLPGNVLVTIVSAFNSQAFYTVDGSPATVYSRAYSVPFVVPNTAVVRIVVRDSSGVLSDEWNSTTNIPQTATPVILPASGSIDTSTLISISCSTPGAVIEYDINGGPYIPYTGPFTVLVGAQTIVAHANATGHTQSNSTAMAYSVTASNLINPSLIVGAYDFDNVGANIVTASPGGVCNSTLQPLQTYPLLAPIVSGNPFSTNIVELLNANFPNVSQRAFLLSTLTTFATATVAYFSKSFDATPGIDLEVSTDLSLTSGGFAPVANMWFCTGGGTATFTLTIGISDSNWHHYAFLYDAAIGKVSAYVDGIFKEQATVVGNTLFQIRSMGFSTSNSNDRRGYGDKLFVSSELISQAAITSLAAGNMPNAAGVLT